MYWKYVWKYFLIFIIKKVNYWSAVSDMSKLFFSKFVMFQKCLWCFHLHSKINTWGVACVTPFGLPQFLTFIYSFRPKALLKCYILTERSVTHFRRIWDWYFKCIFWLPKSIKLYILNIRDEAELESLNCLKARKFSRFWHQLVSDRLVTLSTPEHVIKLGVCVMSFKSQVQNLYI